jgi:hypothetical protein
MNLKNVAPARRFPAFALALAPGDALAVMGTLAPLGGRVGHDAAPRDRARFLLQRNIPFGFGFTRRARNRFSRKSATTPSFQTLTLESGVKYIGGENNPLRNQRLKVQVEMASISHTSCLRTTRAVAGSARRFSSSGDCVVGIHADSHSFARAR